MLQQDEPDDYVVATGETHSIRELLDIAFARVGIDDWHGYVTQDPRFFRPAEVDLLVGDASKAHDVLGWRPDVGFEELVRADGRLRRRSWSAGPRATRGREARADGTTGRVPSRHRACRCRPAVDVRRWSLAAGSLGLRPVPSAVPSVVDVSADQREVARSATHALRDGQPARQPGRATGPISDARAGPVRPDAPARRPVAGRAALKGAGPIALAGLMANLANIGVTLLVARLLSTRGYGALRPAHRHLLRAVDARLGAAGRRRAAGHGLGAHRAGSPGRGWAVRTRRRALVVVAAWAVLAIADPRPARGPARRCPGPAAVRDLDRRRLLGGALRRPRPAPGPARLPVAGGNLLVEGLFRGVPHDRAGRRRPRRRRRGRRACCCQRGARRGARPGHRCAARPHGPAATRPRLPGRRRRHRRRLPQPTSRRQSRERRSLARDVGTALAALALLALLQNLDVVVLGRAEPGQRGRYAADLGRVQGRWCSPPSCWPASCCRRRPPAASSASTPCTSSP